MLREVALVFLKLGITAFGGPAAHIALMKEEFVARREWLTEEEFLEVLGAANLLPGPTSTELAIHIGHRRAGWPGLLVAGAAFILPSALIVGILAVLYTRYGTLPHTAGVLKALQPVVFAVLAQVCVGLARPVLSGLTLVLLGAATLGLSLWGAPPLPLLLGCGLVTGLFAHEATWRARLVLACVCLGIGLLSLIPIKLAPGSSFSDPSTLFLVFFKLGWEVWGSGYVLLAFLRDTLVGPGLPLTEKELLDAVALGQATPGPVFTTATFLGYRLGGSAGAISATLGIFLPAFACVALSAPLLPRLRQWPGGAAFLSGINAGALGLLGAVLVELVPGTLSHVPGIAIAAGSLVLLLRWRVDATWLLLGAAVFGFFYLR